MRRLAHYVFYVLSGGLLALFPVGYAARYVHPQYAWWAELVAIGLPYISLAIVGAAVAAGALRAWRLLAAHAVVLGLIVLRFGLPVPFQAEETQPEEDFQVMTLNISHWNGPSSEAKSRRLRALVQREDVDLLALQESMAYFNGGSLSRKSRSYVRMLTDSLGYHIAQSQNERRTPQPVLGQVPLRDLSQKTLRLGPAEEDVTYVVRTTFRWQGRRAVIYNVHLRSFGSEKPWEAEDPDLLNFGFWVPYLRQYRRAYRARAREVEQIRTMLDQETQPVIVAGDFNSTPHSWAYRQLAAGMQDAFHLTGSGWGSTYHARLPFARIDFVLASEEWDIVNARIPDADLSDHRPLLATLRWRETEEGDESG